MGLVISKEKLNAIHQNGEQAYPDEGAGLMLGRFAGDEKQVETILPLTNTREDTDRHNRYLLDPQDYLKGEMEAARLGLDVLGVFHSHPDHPSRPSEFDQEWAIPWFSYVITSIQQGKAVESRSWLLAEDRSTFLEETIEVKD